MGKSTISMAIFNSYVKLPEGSPFRSINQVSFWVGGFLKLYGVLRSCRSNHPQVIGPFDTILKHWNLWFWGTSMTSETSQSRVTGRCGILSRPRNTGDIRWRVEQVRMPKPWSSNFWWDRPGESQGLAASAAMECRWWEGFICHDRLHYRYR